MATNIPNFIFKDIDLDFSAHPNTKKLVVSKGDLAVRRALKYLVLTNFGDRPFHPEIGCNVRALLFNNVTQSTAMDLHTVISEAIENYEPRVELSELIVDPEEDQNGYNISLKFFIVNQSVEQTVEFFLERLR